MYQAKTTIIRPLFFITLICSLLLAVVACSPALLRSEWAENVVDQGDDQDPSNGLSFTATPSLPTSIGPTNTPTSAPNPTQIDTPTSSPTPAAAFTEPPPVPSPSPVDTPTMVVTQSGGLEFDGDHAFQQLEAQMKFGPRWPGSEGHADVGDYIIRRLEELNWSVEEQRFDYRDVQGRNIIGRANEGAGPVIILGAHYDTRMIADRSPGEPKPVPRAVDGASGVAVLLELARILTLSEFDREIWLAFFDIEDQGGGGMPGYDWIVGSNHMSDNLTVVPEEMILVDMVGDADQQLYFEGNSDPILRSKLWQIAGDLGFEEQFIPADRYTLIDDHLPFARRGIPAVDIIDFDYPHWHTVDDTTDKASPESLWRVGKTLEVWLEEYLDN